MSQSVAIHPHPVPFSSTSPTTTESNSFSSSLCFRFRFGFPSRASPLISILCFGRQTCPSMGGAIPLRQEGSLQDESASFLHLQPICSEAHFDRVIAEAQQREDAVLVVWMASWCRKCIYLKPKLEKLAAEYFPRLQFYNVDVNTVSHKLVARAGVTKMPTIQLWKDGKKQAEVIGGHKAYLVINEVQEMIENESTK